VFTTQIIQLFLNRSHVFQHYQHSDTEIFLFIGFMGLCNLKKTPISP